MGEITIRKLKEDDLFKGFLESLDSLREASNLEKGKANQIFKKIESNPNHIVFVAVLDGKVIGSTTLLIEPKFIHDGGHVGHIEDVVVSKDMQGKGVGEKLIKESLDYAKNSGCYKTILDCTEEVRPFYEKIGFKRNADAMRFDH